MKRAFRLRRQRDFRRLRQQGQVWLHPLVVLRVAPNDLAQVRVGVTAGRVVGKAVVRNRVKRRLREILRRRLPRLQPGYDLWWIARRRARSASFAELEAAVDALLQRARLLRPAEPSSSADDAS